MNKDILQGKWNQIKGGLRKRWGKLTDNDLESIHGDMEKFIGVVQERYGYKREQAEREAHSMIDAWLQKRRGIAGNDARRIAANIAKLPELSRKT